MPANCTSKAGKCGGQPNDSMSTTGKVRTSPCLIVVPGSCLSMKVLAKREKANEPRLQESDARIHASFPSNRHRSLQIVMITFARSQNGPMSSGSME